jgi:hypothetical protein
MKAARRNFLKYSSILGLMTLPGFSLFAKEATFTNKPMALTDIDREDPFDPDGWL